MNGFPARLLCTLQVMMLALFPGHEGGAVPPEVDGVRRCAPGEIRGGMARLLDSQGELRLFFPDCLAIAAPVLLFRLKREGFSRCSVQENDGGLVLRGRR